MRHDRQGLQTMGYMKPWTGVCSEIRCSRQNSAAFTWSVVLLAVTFLSGAKAHLLVPQGSISTACWNAYWPTLASQCRSIASNTPQDPEQPLQPVEDMTQTLYAFIAACLDMAYDADDQVAYLMAPVLGFIEPFSKSVHQVTNMVQARASNLSISLETVSFVDWGSTLLDMARSRPPNFEYGNPPRNLSGFIIDNIALPDLNVAIMTADLTALIQNDKVLKWQGIHSFYRSTVINDAGLIQAVPFGGVSYQLYYRSDVLAAAKVQVPNTWDDLLAAAAAVHGRDMNGDGNPDAGICLMRAPGCFGGFNLAAIWTSYVQSLGTSQGAYFDAVTMQPFVSNAAMQRAMEIYIELKRYGHPSEHELCLPINLPFLTGQCAFTLGFVGQFKANSLHPSSKVVNTARVAMLPGSTQVLNRTTGLLENCTSDTCTTASMEWTANHTRLALVNRAPFFALGSVSAGISSRAPVQLQQLLYQVYARAGGPVSSWSMVLDRMSELGPFRTEHFDPQYIKMWTDAGYNKARTSAFLSTVLSSIEHPNLVTEPRVSVNITSIRGGFTNAANALDSNTTTLVDIPNIMGVLGQLLTANYNASVPGAGKLRDAYRFGIGYKSPSPPSPSTPPPWPTTNTTLDSTDSSSGISFSSMLGIICGVVVGFGALLALALALAYHAANGQNGAGMGWRAGKPSGPVSKFLQRLLLPRMLNGPVTAPGKGPDTTLIVTDVEKSTELWEALDAHIMDKVWTLHHGCMRLQAANYSGYESQTEGDSFILGFPDAAMAVNFCIDTQRALTELDWPQPLLDHPLCAPVYFKPVRAAKVQRAVRSGTMSLRGAAPPQSARPEKQSTFSRYRETLSNAVTGVSGHQQPPLSPGSADRNPRLLDARDTNTGPWDDFDAVGEGNQPPSILGLPAYLRASILNSPIAGSGQAREASWSNWKTSAFSMTAQPHHHRTAGQVQEHSDIAPCSGLTFKPELASPLLAVSEITPTLIAAGDEHMPMPSAVLPVQPQQACSDSQCTFTMPSLGSANQPCSRQMSETIFRVSDTKALVVGTLSKQTSYSTKRSQGGLSVGDTDIVSPVDESGFPPWVGLGMSSAGDRGATTGGSTSFDKRHVSSPYCDAQSSSSQHRLDSRQRQGVLGAIVNKSLMLVHKTIMGASQGDDSERSETHDSQQQRPSRASSSIFTRRSAQSPSGHPQVLVHRSAKSISWGGLPTSMGWGSRAVLHSQHEHNQPPSSSYSLSLLGMPPHPSEPQTFHMPSIQTEHSSAVTKQTSVHMSNTFKTKGQAKEASWQSFEQAMYESWKPCAATANGAVLAWRGLRVRMGGATGMYTDTDLIYNEAAGRLKYSGVFLDLAKSISYVANGGQVVIPESTRLRLPPSFINDIRKTFLLYMGEYQIESSGKQQMSLYLVGKKWSLCRLIEAHPLRAVRLSLGALEAPTGAVSVASVSIISRHQLRKTGGRVCEEVFCTFDEAVLESTYRHRGYIMPGAEPTPGRVQAVFSSAHAATSWALDLQHRMMWHSWSLHVLNTTGFKVIHATGSAEDGSSTRTVFRGPRVKAAIVHGVATWSLNATTGQIQYHGSVIKELNQYQAAALAGMVLVSRPAVQESEAEGLVCIRDDVAPWVVNASGNQNNTSTSAMPHPAVLSMTVTSASAVVGRVRPAMATSPHLIGSLDSAAPGTMCTWSTQTSVRRTPSEPMGPPRHLNQDVRTTPSLYCHPESLPRGSGPQLIHTHSSWTSAEPRALTNPQTSAVSEILLSSQYAHIGPYESRSQHKKENSKPLHTVLHSMFDTTARGSSGGGDAGPSTPLVSRRSEPLRHTLAISRGPATLHQPTTGPQCPTTPPRSQSQKLAPIQALSLSKSMDNSNGKAPVGASPRQLSLTCRTETNSAGQLPQRTAPWLSITGAGAAPVVPKIFEGPINEVPSESIGDGNVEGSAQLFTASATGLNASNLHLLEKGHTPLSYTFHDIHGLAAGMDGGQSTIIKPGAEAGTSFNSGNAFPLSLHPSQPEPAYLGTFSRQGCRMSHTPEPLSADVHPQSPSGLSHAIMQIMSKGDVEHNSDTRMYVNLFNANLPSDLAGGGSTYTPMPPQLPADSPHLPNVPFMVNARAIHFVPVELKVKGLTSRAGPHTYLASWDSMQGTTTWTLDDTNNDATTVTMNTTTGMSSLFSTRQRSKNTISLSGKMLVDTATGGGTGITTSITSVGQQDEGGQQGVERLGKDEEQGRSTGVEDYGVGPRSLDTGPRGGGIGGGPKAGLAHQTSAQRRVSRDTGPHSSRGGAHVITGGTAVIATSSSTLSHSQSRPTNTASSPEFAASERSDSRSTYEMGGSRLSALFGLFWRGVTGTGRSSGGNSRNRSASTQIPPAISRDGHNVATATAFGLQSTPVVSMSAHSARESQSDTAPDSMGQVIISAMRGSRQRVSQVNEELTVGARRVSFNSMAAMPDRSAMSKSRLQHVVLSLANQQADRTQQLQQRDSPQPGHSSAHMPA